MMPCNATVNTSLEHPIPAGIALSGISCAICFEPATNPATVCKNAHNYCKSCIEIHHESGQPNSDKCPTCRAPLLFDDSGRAGVHNATLKEIIDHQPFECPKGCKEVFFFKDWAQHRMRCIYVPIDCPFKPVGCDCQVARKDMDKHLQDNILEHHTLMMNSQASAAGKMEQVQRMLRGYKEQQREQAVAMERRLISHADSHNASVLKAISELSSQVAEGARAITTLNRIAGDCSRLGKSKRGREELGTAVVQHVAEWQGVEPGPATPEQALRKRSAPGAPSRVAVAADSDDGDDVPLAQRAVDGMQRPPPLSPPRNYSPLQNAVSYTHLTLPTICSV